MFWEAEAGSVVFDTPERLTDVSSWHTHIPFALWCIEALRPRVFVELGTHKGDSYCAFCQAVVRVSSATECYAVDTWRGDHEAGLYGEDVLADLQRHHDPRYGSFSRLVRSTFDEAASHFSDGAIDLLHIDGLHTYEAVRHDFETWLPKLSRSGVVLFHDIGVRESDFGVWRYWEELSARYSHFRFLHGHGLGVLLVGADAPEAARRLAACDAAEVVRVRSFFAGLGEAVSRLDRERELGLRAARTEEELSRRTADRDALARERDALTGERDALTGERDALARERDALTGERDEASRQLEIANTNLKECLGSWPFRLARLLGSGKRLPRRLGHGARVFLDILYWAATLQLRSGLRRRKYARIVRRSGLFDVEYYLAQCGDDPAARKDPVQHYLVRGAMQGLDPNPFFDTSAYAERNPASAARDKSPLVHFIRSGGAAKAGTAGGGGGIPTGAGLLACHPFRPPGGEGEQRVLVVDHRLPMPDQDAGSVRMLAMVKMLVEMGRTVTFVSDSDRREERYEDLLRRLGVAALYGRSSAVEHLAAEGHLYRWVLLSRPEQAFEYQPPVRAHAPYAKVIYDTVDLHWVRMEREAKVAGTGDRLERARRFKRMETAIAACSDVVLTVTDTEKETILAEVPGARVEVVPTVHECRTTCPAWEGRKDLMFIGGFEHSPNVDAMRWFVERIMPLVRKELPGVVLHVIGSRAPDEVKRLASPSVHIAGYVPDVDEYFERCMVFVSPLRFGAGLKGKNGQSMSQGLPVVTTSIGAEGMGLVDGQQALVADSPEAFAAAVVRLYSDRLLWARLSAGGMRHVQARYSPEVVRKTLEAILGERAAAEGTVSGSAA